MRFRNILRFDRLVRAIPRIALAVIFACLLLNPLDSRIRGNDNGKQTLYGSAHILAFVAGITKPVPVKHDFDLLDLLWPLYNTIDGKKGGKPKEMLGPLYEQDNPQPFYILPGERIILPKQRQFLQYIYKFDGTLYGGAAGGGKSVILLLSHFVKQLGWAEQGITGVPTGMFCNTFSDLEKRIVPIIDQFIPKWLGRFYSSKDRYYFQIKPKYGGGKIYLCNMQNTDKYRSVAFAYETFDEITLADQMEVQNIVSRMRSDKVRCTWAAATNPGGPGHKYIYDIFVNPLTRTKPRYSPQFKGWTRGNAFIQCLPTENPFLTKEYYMSLEELTPSLRDAVLYGKWDTFFGQFFSMLNTGVHTISDMPVPDEVPKFMSIDHGTSHPTVCTWWAFYPPDDFHKRGRLVCYREYSALGKFADEHKWKMWDLGKDDKNLIGCTGGHDMFAFKGSKRGDITVAEMYNSKTLDGDGKKTVPSFNMTCANKDREAGWAALSRAFGFRAKIIKGEFGKERKIIIPPMIQISQSCSYTWSSLTHCIHKKTNEKDVQDSPHSSIYGPGMGTDEADTCRMAIMYASMNSLSRMYKKNAETPKEISIETFRKNENYAGDDHPYSRF